MSERQDADEAYTNPVLDDIDKKGVYQELDDFRVDLPPRNKKSSRTSSEVAADPYDYHDSVEFGDATIQNPHTPDTTVHVTSEQTMNTKKCNTKNILLIVSGIILFCIMIVIIGILASHLVTDNDKQEQQLMTLERRLLREENENDLQRNQIHNMKKEFNNSDRGKIPALIENISTLNDDLKKLKNVISEIHCGVCKRHTSDKVLRGYYCDCQDLKEMRDCLEFYQNGFRINGIYKIHQHHRQVISVYCDQSKDGGGWTVFQRRRDGSVLFNRNWTEYVNGFGDLMNNHWLGNQNIFTVTFQSTEKGNELRVELEDWDGVTKYAAYETFGVDNADTNFKLNVGKYRGTAGDSLTYSNGMPFSTNDKENDIHDQTHCAAYHKGGWWYKRCSLSNLNGEYHTGKTGNIDTGIFWEAFKGMKYSLKQCVMKVRRNV